MGLDAELVPGRSGVFDVQLDGSLLWSKHRAGRFPESHEIIDRIKSARTAK